MQTPLEWLKVDQWLHEDGVGKEILLLSMRKLWMDMFVILIVAMVSWVYAVNIHQFCVSFVVCQLYCMSIIPQ